MMGKAIKRAVLYVGLMAVMGSYHYHYADVEHYVAYHTLSGVMSQYYNAQEGVDYETR